MTTEFFETEVVCVCVDDDGDDDDEPGTVHRNHPVVVVLRGQG